MVYGRKEYEGEKVWDGYTGVKGGASRLNGLGVMRVTGKRVGEKGVGERGRGGEGGESHRSGQK